METSPTMGVTVKELKTLHTMVKHEYQDEMRRTLPILGALTPRPRSKPKAQDFTRNKVTFSREKDLTLTPIKS